MADHEESGYAPEADELYILIDNARVAFNSLLPDAIRAATDSTREETEHLAKSLLHTMGFFFKEAQRCIPAEAYFASGVLCCAGIEALLLLFCMAERPEVEETKAWNEGTQRSLFLERLQSPGMNLQRTIKIGAELGWFSMEGLPKYIMEAFSSLLTADQLGMVKEAGAATVLISAFMSRTLRNYLHPARRLKATPRVDSSNYDRSIGIVTLFFTLVVLTGLIEVRRESKGADQRLQRSL